MTIRTTGLTRRYGAVTALDGVDVAFRAGAVHGLLGRSGAGKTTLLRVLVGQEFPDAGTVTGVPASVCLVREDQRFPETYRVADALRAASPAAAPAPPGRRTCRSPASCGAPRR
jgi:ABC-2 type transport system ATP-binding protein